MQNGFGIMIRNTRKIEGVNTYMTVACHRYSEPNQKALDSLKPKPIVKTNCKARLCAKRMDEDNKWRVTQFDNEHNHNLSPSKAYRFRCNRKLTNHAKRSLNLFDEAGIPMNKSYNALVVEHGGHENMTFSKKDCENYMRTIRRLRLAEGDAVALQNYFNKAQSIDSKFYYSMDLDDENRIKNLFWADARCRAAYKEFGDIVTFDTTYLTNNYDMPFAPFVGVNHHGQSILLGCGLISNEDTPTFIWLFETWLTCMSGYPPNAIITDQDRAMQNAIEKVFPNARHRWCLWHIMKKIPEKLKGYKEYDSIKFQLQNIVYDSIEVDTFELGWSSMISNYNLKNNDWLNRLYDGRHKWVPCFVKDCFWAGMSTTQRSESMNAFFDGYVNAKTSLREFVGKYDNALKDKVEKEVHADTRSLSTTIPCVTPHVIEKQFQENYTNDKFKEFQKEMINIMYCECMMLHSAEVNFNYQVEEIQYVGDSQIRRTIKYNVCFIKEVNDEYDVKYGCRLFEFRGIICRHIIKVLLFKQNVFTMSSKYILRRWRKNVKIIHSRTKVTYSTWKDSEEKRMYDMVCDAFYRIVDLATQKIERCNNLVDTFKKLELEWDKNDEGISKKISIDKQISKSEGKKSKISDLSLSIHSPIKKRCKGRPPTRRKQSKVDTVVQCLKKKSKKGGKKNCIQSDMNDLSEELLTFFPEDGSNRLTNLRQQTPDDAGGNADIALIQDVNDDNVLKVVAGQTSESAVDSRTARPLVSALSVPEEATNMTSTTNTS
ncbi:protein FAR1-RELATED SEQUENCE 5-like isoform X1 [Daucus carota subsp. sativus]|uniref:protein FAR1-RELATED SEQUENCE 5-like isoform X1 n=2 Tax=Daucus carota subsp. sativus TaxID=79200 RepID=UPI003082FC8E